MILEVQYIDGSFLKKGTQAMNASLVNPTVQMVIISVGPKLIHLFSQKTNKSTYAPPTNSISSAGHSLEELVDTLVDLEYKLVDARFFRDPGITGNFRLMLYSSNHAPKDNIPGAKTILHLARAFAGGSWKVSMAYTPYYGSSSEDGHTVLNIHLIPKQSLFALLGMRIIGGWNRLNGRFA